MWQMNDKVFRGGAGGGERGYNMKYYICGSSITRNKISFLRVNRLQSNGTEDIRVLDNATSFTMREAFHCDVLVSNRMILWCFISVSRCKRVSARSLLVVN